MQSLPSCLNLPTNRLATIILLALGLPQFSAADAPQPAEAQNEGKVYDGDFFGHWAQQPADGTKASLSLFVMQDGSGRITGHLQLSPDQTWPIDQARRDSGQLHFVVEHGKPLALSDSALPPGRTLFVASLGPATENLKLVASQEPAQTGPPGSDIAVVRVSTAQSPWRLDQLRAITKSQSYDNQPSFSPDGTRLFFTSEVIDQTELMSYNLRSGVATPIAETPESEYSPTPVPGHLALSAIQVEADGRQRLWQFPLEAGAPEVILPNVEPVGYHLWVTPEILALFVLGEPHQLEIVERSSQSRKVIATDIGRSLHLVPATGEVSYIQNHQGEASTIVAYNLASEAKRRLGELPAGVQDFIWLDDHTLLVGHGSELKALVVGDESALWRTVLDLSHYRVGGLTRLASFALPSHDDDPRYQLALVHDSLQPPASQPVPSAKPQTLEVKMHRQAPKD